MESHFRLCGRGPASSGVYLTIKGGSAISTYPRRLSSPLFTILSPSPGRKKYSPNRIEYENADYVEPYFRC